MAERKTRVFEWLLLIVVISIIVLLAVGVYTRMASDVQQLSFRLAAQNFETAVSGVRAQWYVQQSRGNIDYTVTVYDQLPGSPVEGESELPVTVYMSSSGWPVNTASLVQAQDGTLAPWECLELWNAFLYQAPLANLEGQGPSAAVYLVSSESVDGQTACRYRHLLDGAGRQYFDYFPGNGRVTVYSSP